MNIAIYSMGYNAEQIQHSHVISGSAIGLYVGGLKKSVERFPDGRIRTPDVSYRVPALRLYFPGGFSEYEYENIRENWWVAFADPVPIYYDFASKRAMLRVDDKTIPVKAELPLSPAEVATVRRQFSEIYAGWQSGTALGKATAELILGGVLARFLKAEFSWETGSPAERFKNLIDSDIQWEFSLDELGARLGLRRDVARKLFIEKFNTTPGQYRIQQRLARIIELISQSDLSLKEIAWQCGLKNVTYLNSLTVKHFNSTPSELVKRFRLRQK